MSPVRLQGWMEHQSRTHFISMYESFTFYDRAALERSVIRHCALRGRRRLQLRKGRGLINAPTCLLHLTRYIMVQSRSVESCLLLLLGKILQICILKNYFLKPFHVVGDVL